MSAPNNDILSWTNQDPRESQLFNSWGVLYRFQTSIQPNGHGVTTLWRTIRPNKEDRVAKLEWSSTGTLGRAVIGKATVPMADLCRADPRIPGSRVYNGPDGQTYRWRPSGNSQDVLLQDPSGAVVAFWRPTRPTANQLGEVHGELHFIRGVGTGTITHPPMMDTAVVTALLYRFCQAFGL
ncbi:hypothetical protein PLICRDRAFT_34188 [Plicaturopsis crispa FD-325 SS-3]|nr:hypothetical protein PLICRDRAFT_34188 [Plicaturopsis crispa FD-325 SS-3]